MSEQQEQQPIVVKSELEQVLTPILKRLDRTIDESQHLLVLLNEQKLDAAFAKIAVFLQEVSNIEEAQQPILAQLEHAYSVEMLDNLRDVLERIQQALTNFEQASDEKTATEFMSKAQFLCEFQLIPMLRNTRRTFYFWGRVDKDPELLKRYYETEFAQSAFNPYVASGDPLPYQVSVVVVAYNKLSMTKRCVESILENTDFERLKGELILVDHGSSDGTLEYFESIPNAKVVHFKHNTMLAMFPILPQICRSPFYVHVANDTVVTKDWLDILLACMQSDPKIVTAAPASCNISNYQGLSVPTDKLEELVEVAKTHNKINPLLWNDRAQVFPPIGIFSVPILNQIGFWDPAIYTFFACDDDFCFKARRSGFRMILCEDVFCYHQGHGTLQDKIESDRGFFNNIQELFKKKNGVYPYGLGTMYNRVEIELLQHEIETNQQLQSKILNCKDKVNLLLINGGIGDTALQLRNILKRHGKQLDIYHLQNTSENINDIKHVSAGYVCSDDLNLVEAVKESFLGVDFSFICVDESLDPKVFSSELAEAFVNRMQDGALCDFGFKNNLYLNNANQVIEFILDRKPLEEWCSLSYSQLEALIAAFMIYFKLLAKQTQNYLGVDIDKTVKMIGKFYGEGKLEAYKSIFVSDYRLVFQK